MNIHSGLDAFVFISFYNFYRSSHHIQADYTDKFGNGGTAVGLWGIIILDTSQKIGARIILRETRHLMYL